MQTSSLYQLSVGSIRFESIWIALAFWMWSSGLVLRCIHTFYISQIYIVWLSMAVLFKFYSNAAQTRNRSLFHKERRSQSYSLINLWRWLSPRLLRRRQHSIKANFANLPRTLQVKFHHVGPPKPPDTGRKTGTRSPQIRRRTGGGGGRRTTSRVWKRGHIDSGTQKRKTKS